MRPPLPNDTVSTPDPPPPDHRPSPASSLRFSGLPDGAAKPGSVIANDILYGADAIATFLFGERKQRRRVYNLVDTNGLPVFRIGVNICARKSVLIDWISCQEWENSGRGAKDN